MRGENQEELKLDVCEITAAVTAKTGHFMNSVLNTCRIYSCAVDGFIMFVFATFIKFGCAKLIHSTSF